ncbi:MAG: hypothetical protein R3B60_05060 [Candidatus Paceibacterota bacterium]
MSDLDKLVGYFEKFPGVGVRQAKRFAFHILTLDNVKIDELTKLMSSLKNSVHECSECHRFFSNYNSSSTVRVCNLCVDAERDNKKLLVVTSDADVLAIERGGVYEGRYFVLGGTVPLLNTKNKEENSRLRGGALKSLVAKLLGQTNENLEVILGFAINPDGENTGRYVESLLKEWIEQDKVIVSHLARGLSTGSELEYADAETIKSALRNRK